MLNVDPEPIYNNTPLVKNKLTETTPGMTPEVIPLTPEQVDKQTLRRPLRQKRQPKHLADYVLY